MKRKYGQNVDGTGPVLTFIKNICHIFALDPAMQGAVQNLKSDLLRLIGKFDKFVLFNLLLKF